jgi:hypothetical protein
MISLSQSKAPFKEILFENKFSNPPSPLFDKGGEIFIHLPPGI